MLYKGYMLNKLSCLNSCKSGIYVERLKIEKFFVILQNK